MVLCSLGAATAPSSLFPDNSRNVNELEGKAAKLRISENVLLEQLAISSSTMRYRWVSPGPYIEHGWGPRNPLYDDTIVVPWNTHSRSHRQSHLLLPLSSSRLPARQSE